MKVQSTVLKIAVVWISAVCFLLTGCGPRRRKIEFVVPDGFRGPFLIIEHPSGQSGAFHEGKLTLTVPSSRILLIEDDSAFSEWTLRSARYANADVLATANDHDRSLVALRGGGNSSGMRQGLIIPPHHSCFVGTDDEFAKCDFRELENLIAIERH